MILLIDNYDSFSYNLYQLIGEIEPDIRVIRNDEMTVEEIRRLAPDRIILSPGPGRPEDAGILIQAVRELGKDRKRVTINTLVKDCGPSRKVIICCFDFSHHTCGCMGQVKVNCLVPSRLYHFFTIHR